MCALHAERIWMCFSLSAATTVRLHKQAYKRMGSFVKITGQTRLYETQQQRMTLGSSCRREWAMSLPWSPCRLTAVGATTIRLVAESRYMPTKHRSSLAGSDCPPPPPKPAEKGKQRNQGTPTFMVLY